MATSQILFILFLSCGRTQSVWNIRNLFDCNLQFYLDNYSPSTGLYFYGILHFNPYSPLVIDRVSFSKKVSSQSEKLYGFQDIASKKSGRGVATFFALINRGIHILKFFQAHTRSMNEGLFANPTFIFLHVSYHQIVSNLEKYVGHVYFFLETQSITHAFFVWLKSGSDDNLKIFACGHYQPLE